jgi:hypothetical protein
MRSSDYTITGAVGPQQETPLVAIYSQVLLFLDRRTDSSQWLVSETRPLNGSFKMFQLRVHPFPAPPQHQHLGKRSVSMCSSKPDRGRFILKVFRLFITFCYVLVLFQNGLNNKMSS